MHIIQEEIGLPKVGVEKISDNQAVLSIEPLPQGYGMTLGNALRRTLVSSLPGTSITSIKFAGASHEFTSLEGVQDSVLNIILNLRRVNFALEADMAKVTLEVSKEGTVTAKDIKCGSEAKVLNPKQVITSIDKRAKKLSIEITVEKGIGYLPITPARQKAQADSIVLEGVFSPIKKVRFEVSPTRHGQRTNLDKLILDIETDGSIAPEDAYKFASQTLASYFDYFGKAEEGLVEEGFQVSSDDVKVAAHVVAEETTQESYTPIETLELSPRTLNALINGDVGSIEKLVKYSEPQLLNLRGFGRKALTEIQESLGKKGLKFEDESLNQ